MSWKLKTAEDGTPELKDGVPVYVDENGGEGPIDPNDMHRKILEVNAESKSRRERIEEMTARLKPLEGIDDVSAYLENAQKAVETVQNLEDSQLVQAGDVEKTKKTSADHLTNHGLHSRSLNGVSAIQRV